LSIQLKPTSPQIIQVAEYEGPSQIGQGRHQSLDCRLQAVLQQTRPNAREVLGFYKRLNRLDDIVTNLNAKRRNLNSLRPCLFSRSTIAKTPFESMKRFMMSPSKTRNGN
jgi:hypothetical protein